MNLPALYLITPNPNPNIENGAEPFIHQLEKSLITGIRLVQLRAKNLESTHYKELAQNVLACCKRYDAKLILNADPQLVLAMNADGVHLDGARLATYKHRPLNASKLVSAACHSPQQLAQAEKIGVDMVTLSPVLSTASHPDAEPLGWENFSLMTQQTRLPIYALGGMNKQLLELAQKNGAYGIAGIRGFWQV